MLSQPHEWTDLCFCLPSSTPLNDLKLSLATSWSGVATKTMWRQFLLVIACSILCNVAIFDHLGPLSNGPCINSSVGKVPNIFGLWPHMLGTKSKGLLQIFCWQISEVYIRMTFHQIKNGLPLNFPFSCHLGQQSCGLEKSKGLNWAI